MTDHERITAEEVRVGDRIARTRTEAFPLVTEVHPCEESVWLTTSYAHLNGGVRRIRPRRTAKLWREVSG